MANGKISKDKTTISLVIPKDLKEQIFTIAAKENRSASNLIVSLIDSYIKINKQQDRILEYYKLLSSLNKDDAE